ncbi:HupE/UreJ family protein [Sorangium sp. So ce119]|uniref:HupE/UreJ family protein n=1 Tax=Sorangium sp. So ce119 TaxID=3133279 RepID=UPI003F62907B
MKSTIQEAMGWASCPGARALLVATLISWPSVSWAHPGGADAGFLKGLFHPVFGADHLLAMVSVGVVSSQLGGKHLLRIPATFVAAMLVGGLLGMARWPMPLGELCIAASVAALGLGIVTTTRGSSPFLLSGCVAMFGVFHGHAHGLEMPHAVSPALYAIGFLLSTTVLHLCGLVLGELAAGRGSLSRGLRYAGAAVMGTGMVLLVRGAGI